jgi:hypothetical protein
MCFNKNAKHWVVKSNSAMYDEVNKQNVSSVAPQYLHF